jgi:hypothetical protein
MAHVLNLSREDPVIHVKAYGGVKIEGVEQVEVTCEIDAPQLATLVEEDGHVYVTVNSSCRITVPVRSSIEIERGMGSVLIENITHPVHIEKVLGNLTLISVAQAIVGKVGGNFSAKHTSGAIQIEKIAGNLTADDVGEIQCEKVGGNVVLRDIHGDCRVEKAGGRCKAQDIHGLTSIAKLGGSLIGRDLTLGTDVSVGGDMKLIGCAFSEDLNLRAGGSIEIALREDIENLALAIRSGGQSIKISTRHDDLKIRDYNYEYQLGDGGRKVSVAAGGDVTVVDRAVQEEELIGDLSDRFTFEESAFSEMIQERIESATRRAEAKVKAAEVRLGQIQEQVEKQRGFKVDLGFGEEGPRGVPPIPERPVPPITRPAGQKGATDEERLMILKMLQDGKISVDEAETLFRAMES